MTDYMATEEETKKHPTAMPAFQAMSAGDPAVFNAMWSFWNFAHVFDDLIDGSNWSAEKKEQAHKSLHDFVTDMLLNPFITRNAAGLQAMMVSSITRNLDGDAMGAKGDPLAPAVRCGDIDVLMHMVYLHRGWEGLREWSKLRVYDKD